MWGECGADCQKTFSVTTPAAYGGRACQEVEAAGDTNINSTDIAVGQLLNVTLPCQPGEGQCPAAATSTTGAAAGSAATNPTTEFFAAAAYE